MIDLNKYTKLKGNIVPPLFPRSYIFASEPLDYTIQYARRYFVKKANDNEIFEVSSKNYKTLPGNIYIKLSLQWQIGGENATEHNKQQVQMAEKKMNGISAKVTNYLLGYKKT